MAGLRLRPYQEAARKAVAAQWGQGRQKTLLVLPTGTGKTAVFSKIAEDRVLEGDRVLILAHRGELLDQAAEKLWRFTGLSCAREQAESSSLGAFDRVTVGSVQTMQREKRLERFPKGYFDVIIVDEAHHCLSEGYQRVLDHFSRAKVLGVTATPDRGDMKNLGSVFDSLAYEYSIVSAVKDGYLCPIRAQTIPLRLDMSSIGIQNGDFKAGDIACALDPYLEKIAEEMTRYCKGRKTVVFLPLIATSQRLEKMLNDVGLRAAEINGQSPNRANILQDFENGRFDVLCNSMLLTEGWDCPCVDCVVVLRPTKVRSLYSQMVGRGTRLFPGKKELLLLDFLWMTQKHELCHPASLVCENEEVAKQMTSNLEAAGRPVDLLEAAETASDDVIAQRENALAKQLEEMRTRKARLVDPLQFELSIRAEDLASYVPSFGWEMEPPSQKQIAALEAAGIAASEVKNAGKASLLLNKLQQRRLAGLATPKQVRLLERNGFLHVGEWSFESANKMIARLAANGWRVPRGVVPEKYEPEDASPLGWIE